MNTILDRVYKKLSTQSHIHCLRFVTKQAYTCTLDLFVFIQAHKVTVVCNCKVNVARQTNRGPDTIL